jgi:hypothetical protein
MRWDATDFATAGLVPASIRLLTQRIDISEVEELTVPETNAHGETHNHRAYGVYAETDQTISLDKDMGFERQRETLLHEVLHAVLAITHLDSVMLTQGGDGFDEHVVSVLSPVLLAWLRDNREVVAYLMETQA